MGKYDKQRNYTEENNETLAEVKTETTKVVEVISEVVPVEVKKPVVKTELIVEEVVEVEFGTDGSTHEHNAIKANEYLTKGYDKVEVVRMTTTSSVFKLTRFKK